MKIAIAQFPGSNCDQDALYALRDMGFDAHYAWYETASLSGFDGVVIPGGFSYGDYLRAGAMASRAPIMDAVRALAAAGAPVLGVCNGFQVLCEAGLLPGALIPNASQRFVCAPVYLRPENRSSLWTSGLDHPLCLPVAHGQGQYVCDESTLKELQESNLVAFRYVDAKGETTAEANVNGSMDSIAGILNPRGNVLGLMPHPERHTRAALGGEDGKALLGAFAKFAVTV